MNARDVEFFVGLERGVWDALIAGDADADRAALAPEFVGVYPTGFANADEHVGQLSGGPTVQRYTVAEARVVEVADGHVMLSYLATYRRPGRSEDEAMYVSSLWSLRSDRWVNVFSQDTPIGDSVV
jgi:hypothetical protein